MKKLLLASTAATLMTGAAFAEDVKVGILLGFTGPLESIMPHMADSAELAFKEISETGKFLGGSTISSVRADSTRVDAAAATAAAERLITVYTRAGGLLHQLRKRPFAKPTEDLCRPENGDRSFLGLGAGLGKRLGLGPAHEDTTA